jgi:hypothetical protein
MVRSWLLLPGAQALPQATTYAAVTYACVAEISQGTAERGSKRTSPRCLVTDPTRVFGTLRAGRGEQEPIPAALVARGVVPSSTTETLARHGTAIERDLVGDPARGFDREELSRVELHDHQRLPVRRRVDPVTLKRARR